MSDSIETTPETEEKKPRRNWLGIIIIWVAIISLLAILGWRLADVNAARPTQGEEAPGFSMEFFDGYEWDERQTADLADMRGKVVVLNFWASWCVECRLEADLIEETWQDYENQDVVFLGVAYADVEPNSIEYLEEFNISYPNAPDLGTSVSNDYEITGVPETFFIDKEGTIQHVQIGPLNQQMMDAVIQQLLEEG